MPNANSNPKPNANPYPNPKPKPNPNPNPRILVCYFPLGIADLGDSGPTPNF